MSMKYKKVIGQASGSSVAAGFIVWYWNGTHPEMPITAELAGGMGALVGPVLAYLVSWLPTPPIR
jgi:hypothetical protein